MSPPTGQGAAKQAFDVIVSSALLVLTFPLFIAIALAIKLSSKGAVLYKQTRVGLHGKPFMILKFRTMVPDAESMIDDVLAETGGQTLLPKNPNDARLTPLGHWLRRWSIDELPQLVNVLRGEMSLVGPRPRWPNEGESDEEWYWERLEVRPGMTGLWQVSGRSTLSFDDYLRLDLFYIENWSFGFDLYLLARTAPAVVAGTGAF